LIEFRGMKTRFRLKCFFCFFSSHTKTSLFRYLSLCPLDKNTMFNLPGIFYGLLQLKYMMSEDLLSIYLILFIEWYKRSQQNMISKEEIKQHENNVTFCFFYWNIGSDYM
jgi:hypothetical protein